LEESPEISVEQSAAPDPTPPPVPPPRSSVARTIFLGADGLRAGWSLLIFLLLWIVMLAGASFVVHAVQAHLHPGPHPAHPDPGAMKPGGVVLNEALMAFFTLLATWIMAKIERRPFQGYGLATRQWLSRLATGMVWGVGFLSLLVFVLREAGLLVFDAATLSGTGALHFGLLWFAAFLLVGVFEETFFRGYMQFTLTRGFAGIFGWMGAANRQALGFWTAAFLLSFGFGFTHKSNPGESPVGLLSAGLIGIVFCLSLWRTGSLWWAIGLHATWDWAQSYLYGVPDSGMTVAGHLYAAHTVGRPVLSGGLTGPEGSIYIVPIVLLIAAVVLATLPRTHRGYTPLGSGENAPALDLA
jgi:membrane protease YdiL (CAAX protease family)